MPVPGPDRAQEKECIIMKRVAVIGLDCLAPELAFDRLKGRMPFFASLRRNCLWGPLRSTDPPITVPAWSCMTTGFDPGELGLYGFRNRRSFDYGPPPVCDSGSVARPRIWDLAGQAGLRSVVLGVPQTYPPRPLNGLMVAGFLSPGRDSRFTFPAGLKDRLDELAGGPYMMDLNGFRLREPSALLTDLHLMTERRFRLARTLMRKEDWDFFMMVEMGPDRLHHCFWQYFDPAHPCHDPGGPFLEAIPDYYAVLDTQLARVWELLPPGTLLLVVSDHGAQPLMGAFAVNEWLMQKGWLKLKRQPEEPCALVPDMVDWPRSLAWADGGYYGRVYLNIKGREPQGALARENAAEFAARLAVELEAARGPEGAPLGNRVHLPKDLYPTARGLPPDLMLYAGNLSLRAAATVGWGRVWLKDNDTGPDGANHASYGVYAAAVKEAPLREGVRSGQDILDIAPTALDWLGLERPRGLRGVSLKPRLIGQRM